MSQYNLQLALKKYRQSRSHCEETVTCLDKNPGEGLDEDFAIWFRRRPVNTCRTKATSGIQSNAFTLAGLIPSSLSHSKQCSYFEDFQMALIINQQSNLLWLSRLCDTDVLIPSPAEVKKYCLFLNPINICSTPKNIPCTQKFPKLSGNFQLSSSFLAGPSDGQVIRAPMAVCHDFPPRYHHENCNE
jgi:hypothetical protein